MVSDTLPILTEGQQQPKNSNAEQAYPRVIRKMSDEREHRDSSKGLRRPADEFRARPYADDQGGRGRDRPDEPDEVRVRQPSQASTNEADGGQEEHFAHERITTEFQISRDARHGGDEQGNCRAVVLSASRKKEREAGRSEEARELESRTGVTAKQNSVVLHQTFAQPEHKERTQRSELQRQIIRAIRRHGVVE